MASTIERVSSPSLRSVIWTLVSSWVGKMVTDSRTARDSSFVEIVGHYNPRLKPAKVEIDRERIDHWVGKGAQLSSTVRTLLKRHLTPAPPAPAEAGKTA